LFILYALPPALAPMAPMAGLAGYVLGVAGRVVAARATGGRVWPDALAHPISVVLFGWLALRSVYLRRRGRLAWRGRVIEM
jgi:hypothetical protein